MDGKIDQETIDTRAQKLGEIGSYCEEQSLRSMIGKTIDIVIDAESDEHEFLLSAKALQWAPEIDGEIYVNDKECNEELSFGVIYPAKITDIAGNKLLATVLADAK